MKQLAIALFSLSASAVSSFSQTTVVVDASDTHQSIDGFGASSAWYADEYAEFDNSARAAMIEFLFDKDTGIGLSIHRPRIHPSPGKNDGNPIYDWNHQGLQLQAKFIKEVQDAYDPIVLATPWTPPDWMKSNNDNAGGSLLEVHYDDYAAYLVEHYIGMKREFGIDIDIVSLQNESDEAKSWDSCIWSADNFIQFINNSMIPEMNAKGVDIPLMLNEETAWDDATINAVLEDSGARSALDYAAAHLYKRTYDDPKPFQTAADQNLKVWMTEYYLDDSQLPGTPTEIESGLGNARAVHQTLVQSRANAYLFWWLCSPDWKWAQGLLNSSHNFDKDDGPFFDWYPTKRAYAFGHFSKFIRPGAVRVNTSPADPYADLLVSAYQNPDGKLVVVAINDGSNSRTINLDLENYNATSLVAYRTSASENIAEIGSFYPDNAGIATVTFPAKTITTLVSSSSSAPGNGDGEQLEDPVPGEDLQATVSIDPWNQYDGFSFTVKNNSASASITQILLTLDGTGLFDAFGSNADFSVAEANLIGDHQSGGKSSSVTLNFANGGLAAGSSSSVGSQNDYSSGDIDRQWTTVEVAVTFSDGQTLYDSMSNTGDSDDGDSRFFSTTVSAESTDTGGGDGHVAGPNIYIETENADNAGASGFSPWSISGNYISWDTGGAWAITDANADEAGIAQYAFDLAGASDISLSTLVDFANGGANSFFVRLSGFDQNWHLVTKNITNGFEWVDAYTWSNVPAGSYTIELQTREANTSIEQLYISTDGSNP